METVTFLQDQGFHPKKVWGTDTTYNLLIPFGADKKQPDPKLWYRGFDYIAFYSLNGKRVVEYWDKEPKEK
jgi:hypothetical protein